MLSQVRAAALIAVSLVALAGCAEIVEPGHRGVQTEWGKVKPQPLGEGFHWYTPMADDIVVFDVRIQRLDSQTVCYTKDLQEATLDVTVTFSLDPRTVPTTLQTIGRDWDKLVINQDVFDGIKRVCGEYTAERFIGARGEAVARMKSAVSTALAVNHVALSGLAITNIKYSDEYDNAVEKKAVAEQEAQAEINVTNKIREKALQRKLDAETDADVMRLKANAIRENQGLLQWEALQVERERIKQWKGGVPLYQFGGGNGPVPLVQLPAPPATAVER